MNDLSLKEQNMPLRATVIETFTLFSVQELAHITLFFAKIDHTTQGIFVLNTKLFTIDNNQPFAAYFFTLR